jgi:hypothetical protein
MSTTQATRTNLTSKQVSIDTSYILGQGQFRIAFGGTYIGGNRNQQEAVCKRFKPVYVGMEQEFFNTDFKVADKASELALDWNQFCELGKEIMITKGDVMVIGIYRYLVEPLIRYFEKFTSNSGWIADLGWESQAMEAFSHYTYHRSGGQLLVCDLQGRYRYNRYSKAKSRFELTDVAICSRQRRYGPTDLGEKGIETFFANHVCNRYCHRNDEQWARPRSPRHWFQSTSQTSMLRSTANNLLRTNNPARFTSTLDVVYDYHDDSDSDDSW